MYRGDTCYGHTLHSAAFKFQSMNASLCYTQLPISYDLFIMKVIILFLIVDFFAQNVGSEGNYLSVDVEIFGT